MSNDVLVPLGARARDDVTGFQGVATSRCERLHGETTVYLEPGYLGPDSREEGRWFSEARLTVLEEDRVE